MSFSAPCPPGCCGRYTSRHCLRRGGKGFGFGGFFLGSHVDRGTAGQQQGSNKGGSGANLHNILQRDVNKDLHFTDYLIVIMINDK
jgi:hypothetical protein